jgi:enolase
MMNVINGGGHAQNSVDFQEFMLVPHGAPSFREALRYGAETFHALQGILKQRKLSTGVGDEGGFAPNLPSNEVACEVIVEAIKAVGLKPRAQVAIALDPAASAFANDGGYDLAKSGAGRKSSREMTELYARWLRDYPIVSLEDGLGENDWAGFAEHTAALGDKVQIVGDDIYVTNTSLIRRGIAEKTTNAVLI